jgi:hypothetical protein
MTPRIPGDTTAWLGMEDSNSETSPLISRDLPNSGRRDYSRLSCGVRDAAGAATPLFASY